MKAKTLTQTMMRNWQQRVDGGEGVMLFVRFSS